jgi:hypothetical protein
MARRLQPGPVMQSYIANPIEVPEDVRAEDARKISAVHIPPPDAVPEDTRSELDREQRVVDAQLDEQLNEGQLPAAIDDPVADA